ncbi:Pseudomonalisin [Ralstonia mannitolilytica]|uniref:S53 family peptidase n=1 Tax=Ralstonia mannitolilytica TaxID=105219 RepID=UPI0007B0132F|nr:S53 family peptidase [Ralstonia mannitolilytica]ANA35554.1 hypothetical protein VZ52_19215 [Ralstonia mannitolilytica]CAJ0688795.1 Pseudomonalisin [Ralstonia mannitolilytica]CAJ0862587.1 Pseudomonalisin [Ralstonia mannitolilytica]
MARQPLRGSERTIPQDARILGDAPPAEQLRVLVQLRRPNQAALEAHLSGFAQSHAAGTPPPAPLTREEWAAQFGASAGDIDAVRAFARDHGLHVAQVDPAAATVTLEGSVQQFCGAFDTHLHRVMHGTCEYRGRSGPLRLPESLQDVVVAVLGLDSRPQADPHFRFMPLPPAPVSFRPARAAPMASYTPVQLARLYGFPQGDGAGQCIALIELGGGYREEDLRAYFHELGVPMPKVTAVPVGQGANRPTGDPNGPDGEVMLDIEVAGGAAPGATLAVYFAPNTDAGFLQAINAAVHDTTLRPSVVSISWGAPESRWTPQAMEAVNAALQSAATMGVTVCVASGDNGSSDGLPDHADHVDFPASSPYALACGGTSLHATDSRIAEETVWNDGAQGGAGGGGVSSVFALPAWQRGLTAPQTRGKSVPLERRGVPDVAGNADPLTGYVVRVDGETGVVGGTSAVAPLWAALVARINASKRGPVGYPHARLYQNPGAFNDIRQGNNGSFAAAPGWDACTGLGSPKGDAIADLF